MGWVLGTPRGCSAAQSKGRGCRCLLLQVFAPALCRCEDWQSFTWEQKKGRSEELGFIDPD